MHINPTFFCSVDLEPRCLICCCAQGGERGCQQKTGHCFEWSLHQRRTLHFHQHHWTYWRRFFNYALCNPTYSYTYMPQSLWLFFLFFAAVILEPCEGAETYVNGKRVTEPTVLRSGLFTLFPPLLQYFFKAL